MYADTDAYRSILALSDAIRSRYPQPRTVGALRFADGMARLHSYCESRIQAVEQTENGLLQRLGASILSAVDVSFWDTYTNVYMIDPGAGRVKRVGSIGAGIGASLHVSALKAVMSHSLGILNTAISAALGDFRIKGEAHLTLFDKERQWDPELVLYAGAQAALLQAGAEVWTGGSLIGASASAEGTAGYAYAEAEAVLSKEEQTIHAGAGVCALRGEVRCVLKIFNVRITLTGSGSIGSAEAEVSFSHKNREWEFDSKLGFIAGLGFKVNVTY